MRKRQFLQNIQVAPQQRVIGRDQIMLRYLFAQDMPRGAHFQYQHLHVGREFFRFTTPVVQHRCRADHQRRFRIFGMTLLQPCEPGKGLQGFAGTHVVGQNTAKQFA